MAKHKDIIEQLIATNSHRAKQDIHKWRLALQMAENNETPKRSMLYGLYKDLILDPHVNSELTKRKQPVKASKFALYKDNEADAEIMEEYLNKSWFYQFLETAVDTQLFGHSLLQIPDLVEGHIPKLQLVRREHIVPEKGIFLKESTDDKGTDYRNDPAYSNWLIEIGETHDLGLLNKAAPFLLYKKFATSAWSEFCEVFGMPLRIAKTNVSDVANIQRLEDMLSNMATASYAIIGEEEQLDFVETAKSNGEVYNNLIERCNNEVSKLINGAVIGEASQGGSRSKEEVGERTISMAVEADKQRIASYINETLLPHLVLLGYPLEGYSFRWEKQKDTKGLWEVTQGLLPHFDVDPEFITEKFGIPVTKKPLPIAETKNSFDPFG